VLNPVNIWLASSCHAEDLLASGLLTLVAVVVKISHSTLALIGSH